jgi:hypothetical protein
MRDWQRHSLTPWPRRKFCAVEPLGRQSTAEPKQEDEMKRLMAVAAMLFMMPVAAGAQDAIPALKDTCHPRLRHRAMVMWEIEAPDWRSFVATRRVLG